MKRAVLVVIFGVFGWAVVVSAAPPPATVADVATKPGTSIGARGHAAKIVCDQPQFDFGEEDNSKTVECSFVLRNEGDTTLVIARARPSCGCTVAAISTKIVPPGSNAVIAAKLNLKGRRGKQHKTITIDSNDPVQPQLTLVMVGTATSVVELEPMRVYVRDLKQGDARTDKVELISRAPEPMRVLSVASTSPLVTAAIETVEEGRRFHITLTTSDTLPRGLTSGRVTILTDSASAQSLSLPFHYQVVGELVVAPEQITFRETKGKTFTRNVIVKPGLVKDFKIERVEPPLPGIQVNIRELGAYGYQVQLLNIPASVDLNGKNVLIVTSVEPMREIRIPFRVIPAQR